MRLIIGFLALSQALFSITPKEALDRLVEGNKRYVADALDNPYRTSLRRMEVYKRQFPFAAIVGCSDSRVPPEIVFDQGLGDLFIVRVAGQVVGPVELDSIEYSVKYLGSSLIFVLGHQSCAAVNAVLLGKTEDIENVAQLIEPAIAKDRSKDLEEAIKDNVRYVVDYLKKTPLIQKMSAKGKVSVVGGYYHLSDGHIEILQ
jgi:carbonic anhydrase